MFFQRCSKHNIGKLIAIAMSVFQLYTAGTLVFTPIIQRSIHLCFGLVLIFLMGQKRGECESTKYSFNDIVLVFLSITVTNYLVFNAQEIMMVPVRSISPTSIDLVFGGIAFLLVLEAARRVLGMPLVLISAAFVIYLFVGPYMPGMWKHPGFSFPRIVGALYLLPEGINSMVMGVSATYIFAFIVFGAFLKTFGATDLFMDLASGLIGHVRGGPAKIAVIASAFFGTISGSGPANVASTGQVTIPLMKRTGYSPVWAGAIEPAASIGGQLMPPVMGAAAFIMAEFTHIPYRTICIAAFIPSLFYFGTLLFAVDLQAAAADLRGIAKSELPRPSQSIKKGWHLIFSVILLFALIYLEFSPMRAAFWAIVCLVLADTIKSYIVGGGFPIRKILDAMESGAKGSVVIVAACGAVGIIVGAISLTGIGITLSGALIDLAHERMLLVLIFAMIASLVLGMGLPTAACYIIVAIIAAPTLIEMGVPVIAAHLFVFYFGIMSGITPPVCVDVFVGAGIANSPPMRTGLNAVKLALPVYILPFMFIYRGSILLAGSYQLNQLVLDLVMITLACFVLVVGIHGYFLRKLSAVERSVFILAAASLFIPGGYSSIAALFFICIGALSLRHDLFRVLWPFYGNRYLTLRLGRGRVEVKK